MEHMQTHRNLGALTNYATQTGTDASHARTLRTAMTATVALATTLTMTSAWSHDGWSVGINIGNPYPPVTRYYAPPPVYYAPPPPVIYRYPQTPYYAPPAAYSYAPPVTSYTPGIPGIIQFSLGNYGYRNYHGPRYDRDDWRDDRGWGHGRGWGDHGHHR